MFYFKGYWQTDRSYGIGKGLNDSILLIQDNFFNYKVFLFYISKTFYAR